jgi:tetratricopeptide (TPR) repeat protein
MPKLVVIIGQLASMTRIEAARVVSLTGGELTERVTRATSLVIVGGRGPQLTRSGRLPIQLARARRMAQEGVSLEVWPEQKWLRSVGLVNGAAGICNRFTASQMAETLKVPRSRLDRWLASGLVMPVETSAGVPLFEFEQIAAVRTLAELVQAGVPLSKVRRAVAHLARWVPFANQHLSELSLDDNIRRLVVRMADGRLAEPTGQLLLDFDRDEAVAASFALGVNETEADAFQRAIECEAERPLEAARVYRDLMDKRGPHATLAFNLANALYAADDLEGAIVEYQRSTTLDPRHAGAWNNLANLLAELDRPDEAIEAYRRALALDARFSDARFNLAQTLVELGRSEESVLHWTAYLAANSESAWAEYARERIESVRHT